MKVLNLFFFLSFCTNLVFSQEHNIRFEKLTVEDGLAENNVTCYLQDNKGFMWFGTYKGLHKYDGHKFTIYMPSSSDSTAVATGTGRPCPPKYRIRINYR